MDGVFGLLEFCGQWKAWQRAIGRLLNSPAPRNCGACIDGFVLLSLKPDSSCTFHCSSHANPSTGGRCIKDSSWCLYFYS